MFKGVRASALASIVLFMAAATTAPARAQVVADDATRYMAMGDSIAAGFKAQPATNGYAFLLYQGGVFDRVPHTLFNDIAAVGATSDDVLQFQVPQALIPASRGGFVPQYITLTVGGNDIAAIRTFLATNPDPLVLQAFIAQTLASYGSHLMAILQQLVVALPTAKIFVGNQYSVPELEALFAGGPEVLEIFNQTTAGVVAAFQGHAYLVDVHAAFLDRNGLLLIERRGASQFEVHLTNAGHRAMAKAFAEVIEENK
jgi:lysophospholipase L1-like esterase